jgi:uncharacterized membrane protein (UPF0127 family)
MQNAKTKKTKLARRLYLILAGVLFAGALFIVFFATDSQKYTSIQINGSIVNAEIATDSQKQKKGLCCRDSLDANSGMLFVYNKPGNYSFWMKDTQIPLDIIWINSSKNIVHIEADVQPESFPETFSSEDLAQYVLEVNAGWIGENGISVGDQATF